MTASRPLANRIALVTGASRGIGRAAALALAEAGAHVVALARTVGGLEELDDEIQQAGGSATLVPVDLKDVAAIDRLGAALFERWGKLDALLGNAGVLGAPLVGDGAGQFARRGILAQDAGVDVEQMHGGCFFRCLGLPLTGHGLCGLPRDVTTWIHYECVTSSG